MATHAESWRINFSALKKYVKERGHFPAKKTTLSNWVKYQRKRIKAGTMPADQMELFLALAASRSTEHTGGRKKKVLAVAE